MVKLLLGRASPRCNIDDVENENLKLPCDILQLRFYGEYEAYRLMRNYFLEHPDYTHLVLATDDVLVRKEHIEILQNDLESKDYPVLCGMMNVEQDEFMKYEGNLNISFELALKDRQLRHYNWIRRNELPNRDMFQVKFNGFALMAIRRDIIEKNEFACDGVFRLRGVISGASVDLVFCWYCHENSIPIFVDKRIDMKHLRTSGKMRVGECSPRTYLFKNGVPDRIKFS